MSNSNHTLEVSQLYSIIDYRSSQKYVLYNNILSVMSMIDVIPESELNEVISSLRRNLTSENEVNFINALEKLGRNR